MRLIVDECCPRLYAAPPRRAGHDVVYIADSDARASDETIACVATVEEWVVVTADHDFGEVVVRRRRPVPGVLLPHPCVGPADVADRRTGARGGEATAWGGVAAAEAREGFAGSVRLAERFETLRAAA